MMPECSDTLYVLRMHKHLYIEHPFLHIMEKVITDDGSVTFYNNEIQDHYHTKSGGREEAFEKHAKALQVDTIKNPVIFDVCFGLGYNAAAALDIIDDDVTVYCFENDREILKKVLEIEPDFKSYFFIKEFVKKFLEDEETIFIADYKTENKIKNNAEEKNDGKKNNRSNKLKLIMMFGDAREEIKKVAENADAVFFDPFSPAKVPELWTKEFFSAIFDQMNKHGKLSTYSCARFVRDNLKHAGFSVRDGPIIGRRSPSTIAEKK
ncbi:hypothetical protein C4573_01735 [Candidatus Woesearchaeota archaeon]|nr:MAG: hypothetical protein C4573_01735 [Candidatus Woesearchaeota archaeon]